MTRLLFVGVLAFAAGVATRDQAQDHVTRACEQEQERATQFAKALAHVLNGGAIETNDVRATCRITPIRKES